MEIVMAEYQTKEQGLCSALEWTLDVSDTVDHQVKRQVYPRVEGLGTRRPPDFNAGLVKCV